MTREELKRDICNIIDSLNDDEVESIWRVLQEGL